MSETGFSPEQIDTTKPHPARMYDFYLGGMDNYEVDRTAAGRVLELVPHIRTTARGNRDFHHRAVRTAVDMGIRQFIDIGTGIPTSPNTHEVARAAAPDARVAYVDNDPIVATYAGAKLTNLGNADFVLADLREPKSIIEHDGMRQLIDFDKPVALMLVAVLHFITEDEDPAGILKELTDRLPDGSALILSHVTGDFDEDRDAIGQAAHVYDSATARLTLRTYDEVLPYFKGFELLEPGLVQPPLWRPDGQAPTEKELTQHAGYAGMGIKGGV
ncbi:SAM-dependent methyltransferase [Streptomyces daliensis]